MNVAVAEKIETKPLPAATLVCVPPQRAREMWSAVEPMIAAGYAAADESIPANILDRFENQHALLWIVVDSSNKIVAGMVTSLISVRSGLICKMVAAGGSELDLWKHFHTRIEEYARSQGCFKVQIEGRRGWLKALEGFEEAAVVMHKRL